MNSSSSPSSSSAIQSAAAGAAGEGFANHAHALPKMMMLLLDRLSSSELKQHERGGPSIQMALLLVVAVLGWWISSGVVKVSATNCPVRPSAGCCFLCFEARKG